VNHTPSESDFLQEGYRIIREGQEQGVPLRLLGSVAIRIHSPGQAHLIEDAQRPLTDLDFMTYGRHNEAIRPLFERLGYRADEVVLQLFGKYRHIYYHDELGLHADIFFDKLSFCHEVDFRGRLELDPLTITVTDLLLEKMQIVEINEKDLKDVAILLREHGLGDDDNEVVNTMYLEKRLHSDWGFTYTFLMNMGKVRDYVDEFSALNGEDRAVVKSRAYALIEHIEEMPKSRAWKMRAKLGTRKRWYNEVEDVER
jgi:hypothetical protein